MRRNYRSIDRVIQRNAGRRSINEIRRRTGIGYAVIEARARRLGVSMNKKRSRDELHQLIREYAGSLSAEQIADMTGYTQAGVYSAALRLGISMRLRPTHQRRKPQSAADRFLRRSA